MTQSNNLDIEWFSKHFGIDEPQYKLPFVDFNLNSDVPLYIDPYAITKDTSDLAALCHNAIISFFQCLIKAIKEGNKQGISRLLQNHLSEPTEIHLGVSRTARGGRGIGRDQESDIVDALASSSAVQQGYIQAIEELELHIPGIGPDKVSDLVANIIKGYLAKYTEEICSEYGISTNTCAVSGFWSESRQEWHGDYFDLPVRDHHSYILVPKRFVRRYKQLLNHRVFYEKYIINILQQQLLSANDSLVETLKNGQRRVTKKSIREDPRFKPSKELITEFIIEHPETIKDYRHNDELRYAPVDPAEWSSKCLIDDPGVVELLEKLKNIKPGKTQASKYHKTILELIKFVFDWCLTNFKIEFECFEGRGRIDIISDNYAPGGIFGEFTRELNGSTVPIECKNYSNDLGNAEYNQLTSRLGVKTSRIGFMFCRTITDEANMMKHLEDRWLRQDKMILVFDDKLLTGLVNLRLERNFKEIQRYISTMVRAVKYGNTKRL